MSEGPLIVARWSADPAGPVARPSLRLTKERCGHNSHGWLPTEPLAQQLAVAVRASPCNAGAGAQTHYHASKFVKGCATFCFLTTGAASASAGGAALPPSGPSKAALMYFPTPCRTGAAALLAPGLLYQLLRWLSGSSGLPASAYSSVGNNSRAQTGV